MVYRAVAGEIIINVSECLSLELQSRDAPFTSRICFFLRQKFWRSLPASFAPGASRRAAREEANISPSPARTGRRWEVHWGEIEWDSNSAQVCGRSMPESQMRLHLCPPLGPRPCCQVLSELDLFSIGLIVQQPELRKLLFFLAKRRSTWQVCGWVSKGTKC